METSKPNVEQNLALFSEMLTCGNTIYTWTYDTLGRLCRTNSPEHIWDKLFEFIGCKSYMLHYAQENTAPLLLSAPLGIMWCAAFERQEDGACTKVHLIGPVLNASVSPVGIEQAMHHYDLPLSWRNSFKKLFLSLPVISSVLFFQYGIMLHYCVTGEKLSSSDIQSQQTQITSGNAKTPGPTKDRHQTYMAEQALLRNVREGNIGYHAAMEHAGQLSSGVRITTDNPVQQTQISMSIFISLCVRAAIEGGLSPEKAYSLGDSYIQSVIDLRSISDLRALNYTMYEDFIRRVHKCRMNPALSPQIQSCCDYIELHLEDELSLKALAERAGYTEYYLSRKFKREVGVSIHNYIKFARIEYAKSLLSDSTMPIHDIAEALHFCSSTHFSDTFRNVAGLLPQDYRQKNQKM